MKILITGIAGFVGTSIAQYFKHAINGIDIIGIDNLSRRGSEFNLAVLKSIGCKFIQGDLRNREDIDDLPKVDWIIDCAAIPTVTAGVESGTLALINNNLTGTIYLLEKCRRDQAGFIILSTSRVYSINALNSIPLLNGETRFSVNLTGDLPVGLSEKGITENFSTAAPVSLYGATKVASELLAAEYHHTFGFPVWINRCGVIAGPGQFGKIDQGIFSFWIYQYLFDRPLSFIGFGGEGKQVRDFIHPVDIARLIELQLKKLPDVGNRQTFNVGGGNDSCMSLLELDIYCRSHLKVNRVVDNVAATRKFDIPYYVTDNSKTQEYWGWTPQIKSYEILNQIMEYGISNGERLKSIF